MLNCQVQFLLGPKRRIRKTKCIPESLQENILYIFQKRTDTLTSRLDIQLPPSRSFSQDVLCRGAKAQPEGALVNMAPIHSYHAVQAPQEIQEFLAWQQDLESDSKSPTQARPTVFRWSGGAKEVFVSGSFNNWATKIPLNRR